jgi:hypothetical protein
LSIGSSEAVKLKTAYSSRWLPNVNKNLLLSDKKANGGFDAKYFTTESSLIDKSVVLDAICVKTASFCFAQNREP